MADAPAQTYPATGATITTDVPILNWDVPNDPGCSVISNYYVVLDDSSNCLSPTHTWTPTISQQQTHTLSNGVYYWRARAMDSLGGS